jgi:acetyl-CoA acyltransferase 1
MDPKLIQEVIVGNVLLPGSGALIFRGACLMAGLSVDSSMMTVNRFCSSGLEAISVVASKIKTGLISIGIAAGVESMSLSDMSNMVEPDKLSDEFLNNELASNCLLPMGITSENVTEKFGLKRETLD